jgi:hypothetical protein
VLDEAEIALELRLAGQGNSVAAGEAGIKSGECPQMKFDPEFALKFLKWREDKRAGRGDRYLRREPSIEEVRDEVIRRIDAIRRHREAKGPEGYSD